MNWQNKKQRVFRKESMHDMFSIFLKASRSWIKSIRTIGQPICYLMVKKILNEGVARQY